MDRYEFINVSVHKKEKNRIIWEVSDGVDITLIEIDVGKDYMIKAITKTMNKLGEDGWFLGAYPYNYYVFTMQRLIKD